VREGRVREAADPALDGDWCLILAPTQDGRLDLQIESRRSPAVLAALHGTDVHDLDGLLQRLSAAASRGGTKPRS